VTLEEFEISLKQFNEAWNRFSKACSDFKVNYSAPAQDKEPDVKLEVTLYTDLKPLSETLSTGRVRIFYKGLNRNRTFISEDFAN